MNNKKVFHDFLLIFLSDIQTRSNLAKLLFQFKSTINMEKLVIHVYSPHGFQQLTLWFTVTVTYCVYIFRYLQHNKLQTLPTNIFRNNTKLIRL